MKVNLHKISFIMKQVRAYAKKADLKPSWTFYKRYGRKGKPAIKLRFSKYGDEAVERGYATHYVSAKRMAELKSPKTEKCEEIESAEEGTLTV